MSFQIRTHQKKKKMVALSLLIEKERTWRSQFHQPRTVQQEKEQSIGKPEIGT